MVRPTRRQLLVALGVGCAGLLSREGAALAGPGPEDVTRRRIQAVTAPGAPRQTDPVVLQRSDLSTYTVPLDNYLKGVVAGEMPASWPAEALKAQAVAARTYTAAWMATFGAIAESNQAYVPGNRTAAIDQAVDATCNQLMLYQGGMIYAYYHSTCGGETTTSPDQAAPYCASVRCYRAADGSGRTPLDLSDPTAAANYWGTTPTAPAFCSPAPYYRWSFTATRAEKERILDQALSRRFANVSPAYTAGQLGTMQDMSVLSRLSSGRIVQLRIVGSGGTWTLTGETDAKWALTSTEGLSARSATAVFTVARDTSGAVTSVNTRGGGYGHDVGLCQYGAKGLADAGYDYRTILSHYYSSITFTTSATQTYAVPTPRAYRTRLPWIVEGGASCS